MGVILIIFLLVLLFWPTIMRWVGRFMARRTEDYIRRATGMPPRPGSREAKKQARQNARAESGRRHYNPFNGGSSRRGSRSDYDFAPDEPIIPREYAEDVEFVETKEFSETTIASDDGSGNRVRYSESQVSDAEWEEIKPKHGKRS